MFDGHYHSTDSVCRVIKIQEREKWILQKVFGETGRLRDKHGSKYGLGLERLE